MGPDGDDAVSPRPPPAPALLPGCTAYPPTPAGRGGAVEWVELGWRFVELVESSTAASSGDFDHSHTERGPEQRPMPRPDSGLWPLAVLSLVLASCGACLHTRLQAAPGDPPPARRRRRRLVDVRTHITVLVTARLGQRHVSPECDLVAREARERLPVRGLTIALGSRHLFRLPVKAQGRFLPDQSSQSSVSGQARGISI